MMSANQFLSFQLLIYPENVKSGKILEFLASLFLKKDPKFKTRPWIIPPSKIPYYANKSNWISSITLGNQTDQCWKYENMNLRHIFTPKVKIRRCLHTPITRQATLNMLRIDNWYFWHLCQLEKDLKLKWGQFLNSPFRNIFYIARKPNRICSIRQTYLKRLKILTNLGLKANIFRYTPYLKTLSDFEGQR